STAAEASTRKRHLVGTSAAASGTSSECTPFSSTRKSRIFSSVSTEEGSHGTQYRHVAKGKDRRQANRTRQRPGATGDTKGADAEPPATDQPGQGWPGRYRDRRHLRPAGTFDGQAAHRPLLPRSRR